MPFDFTHAMEALCNDITERLPALRHIEMQQVAVGYRQTRRAVSHGLQASLTPLRFEGGATTGKVRGKWYESPQFHSWKGNECLYLLNFYLPRFLEHPFEEKLTIVFHELWHMGPRMDGDLRRHEGRCFAHGASQREFDEHAATMARDWLALDPPHAVYSFLEATFEELQAEHGAVVGQTYEAPKLRRLRATG